MGFLDVFSQSLSAGNVLAFPLALAGGVVAGMNPCCLALYPAASGACCAMKGRALKRSFGNASAFVFGVAISVAGLGLLAAYIGRIVVVSEPFKYAVAFLPILMGAFRLGWLPLPAKMLKLPMSGRGGAFGSGLLLSLIIGPCGTPLLASVLSYAAYEHSFMYSGLLLFLYGIGNGLPLVLVGTAAGGLIQRLEENRAQNRIDIIVGGTLLLLGFYLLWRV